MDKTKTKNIKQVSAKIFYLVVTISELGAVIMLSLVKGETAGTIARVIAVPLAMDFFTRVLCIVKPYFKNK